MTTFNDFNLGSWGPSFLGAITTTFAWVINHLKPLCPSVRVSEHALDLLYTPHEFLSAPVLSPLLKLLCSWDLHRLHTSPIFRIKSPSPLYHFGSLLVNSTRLRLSLRLKSNAMWVDLPEVECPAQSSQRAVSLANVLAATSWGTPSQNHPIKPLPNSQLTVTM